MVTFPSDYSIMTNIYITLILPYMMEINVSSNKRNKKKDKKKERKKHPYKKGGRQRSIELNLN